MMPVHKPLRLRAETADDLPALSALVQDMTVLAHDIGYDSRARRLVLMGNRFRWEAGPDTSPTRVRAALRIDFATAVQHRAMPADATTVLDLLAVTTQGDRALTIAFAGGPAIRASIDSIDVFLDDMSAPWPARATPDHPDTDG